MAIPTIKRKNGITKSARVQPFHGAWPITGHSSPASSTKIINWTPIDISNFMIIIIHKPIPNFQIEAITRDMKLRNSRIMMRWNEKAWTQVRKQKNMNYRDGEASEDIERRDALGFWVVFLCVLGFWVWSSTIFFDVRHLTTCLLKPLLPYMYCRL